jgi:hypothetical protein
MLYVPFWPCFSTYQLNITEADIVLASYLEACPVRWLKSRIFLNVFCLDPHSTQIDVIKTETLKVLLP